LIALRAQVRTDAVREREFKENVRIGHSLHMGEHMGVGRRGGRGTKYTYSFAASADKNSLAFEIGQGRTLEQRHSDGSNVNKEERSWAWDREAELTGRVRLIATANTANATTLPRVTSRQYAMKPSGGHSLGTR